jgi:hypothetical protein
MDVQKFNRIPEGGGWGAHGRDAESISRDRATKVGYDYVHSRSMTTTAGVFRDPAR